VAEHADSSSNSLTTLRLSRNGRIRDGTIAKVVGVQSELWGAVGAQWELPGACGA